jgi:hypothetical protein
VFFSKPYLQEWQVAVETTCHSWVVSFLLCTNYYSAVIMSDAGAVVNGGGL